MEEALKELNKYLEDLLKPEHGKWEVDFNGTFFIVIPEEPRHFYDSGEYIGDNVVTAKNVLRQMFSSPSN